MPASPAASPAPSRRAAHGKRLLRKQSSANSLEEPTGNGTALAPSPGARRRMAKHKASGTPGAASSSGSTAALNASSSKQSPGHQGGGGGRAHAADVSQSSSSGQESPNKSERRRRVSILSRKPRRAASPTDAILPADHTTTASERERTNSASSRDSHVSAWRAAGRRRLSSLRRDSSERESGKVPWCGCWGNGCL
ncbi:hypothetical protein ONE63_009898 [Megalurothrips usitatus]|uniref:Uncharacterized protein n=1 Tax=Megalurothrips usitatus TaxID=439358 RepID=A0AAV7XN16_9NEOP|nr:hypothetical protein ONE63_009898 [Megalurothrips usitatus]